MASSSEVVDYNQLFLFLFKSAIVSPMYTYEKPATVCALHSHWSSTGHAVFYLPFPVVELAGYTSKQPC